jgi:outer membrane murein-binding lipoprotein Lpp
MSRFDIAVQRFNAAVDMLESRTAPLAGLKASAADSKARIAELAEERDRLVARVAELEEENRALAATTEEVEGRLDGAIGEIRAALGR